MEVIKTPSPRFRFLLAALFGAASYSDPRPRRPRYTSGPKPRRNPLDKRPMPAGISKDAVSIHYNHQKGAWFEWRPTGEEGELQLWHLGTSIRA